ncbi:MAG TPA: folate-binding protein [Rubrivivax sp.]|jgi:folate-binding protein YgfZ|nr:folate-binding protein [Rubrivivax sp.]
MLTDLPSALPTDPDLVEGGALKLQEWGLIRVSGVDARAFLHSQLTQDIQSLPASAARLAGFCSAKGRLLASFVAWAEGAQDVLLACSADLLPQAIKRLSMFVLRARCRLLDARPEWGLFGVSGQAVSKLAPDVTSLPDWGLVRPALPDPAEGTAPGAATLAIKLPPALIDGRVIPRALWVQAADRPAPIDRTLDASVWNALEACSGVPRIVAATVDQFVPQMVNLEALGGVSFSKGCYPGQEVVARSQYRGTLKRRAHVVECASPLAPGAGVFHVADPGQPAGMVVNAGTLAAGRHLALVELKLALASTPGLFADAGMSLPLHRHELPYTLPVDAA